LIHDVKLLLTQLPTRLDDGRRNFDAVERILERYPAMAADADLLVLPELIGCEISDAEYERSVRDLARRAGCYVVGGTHHSKRGRSVVNRGAVSDPAGSIVAEYEKMRPYGVEAKLGVKPGTRAGSFRLRGRTVAVFVCSDFWYSESFLHDGTRPPDMVVVTALSITQRPSPMLARTLWKHMAVARAYEFAAYVGVSDWRTGCTYGGQPSCGVAGLANPRPFGREGFFSALNRGSLALHELNFERLEGLRTSRSARGFPWKRPASTPAQQTALARRR